MISNTNRFICHSSDPISFRFKTLDRVKGLNGYIVRIIVNY